jgi:hypothetical protein
MIQKNIKSILLSILISILPVEQIAAETIHYVGVGVGDYTSRALKLNAPPTDISLGKEFFYQTSQLSKGNVTTIINKQATWHAIVSNIRYTIAKAAPDDLVIIHMSGHGTHEGGRYSFYPVEALAYSRQANISEESLLNALLFQRTSVRRILLLDSCYSGAFAFFCPKIPIYPLLDSNLALFAACGSNELAFEKKDGSVLMKHLKTHMRDADVDNDNCVDVEELSRWLVSEKSYLSMGADYPNYNLHGPKRKEGPVTPIQRPFGVFGEEIADTKIKCFGTRSSLESNTSSGEY